MRSAFVGLLVSMTIISCGNSSGGGGGDSTPAGVCATSVLAGTWKGNIAGSEDIMTFNQDCSGSSTYCQSAFTYPNVTAIEGLVSVSNNATNAKTGCLGVGTFSCAYQISGTTLGFNCGGGTVTFTKP